MQCTYVGDGTSTRRPQEGQANDSFDSPGFSPLINYKFGMENSTVVVLDV